MTQTKLYRVLRDHIGPDGQLFSPHGQFNTRKAISGDVTHLIPLTLSEIVGEKGSATVASEVSASMPKKEARGA